MALDDIKDSAKEQFGQLAARVQESEAWAQISEKFQSLPPAGQIGALIGGATMFVLIVLMVPYLLFYSSSQDYVTEFEDKRSLINELFRSTRDAQGLPPSPRTISASELESSARAILSQERLQPEQTVGISDLGEIAVPGISKANVDMAAISVRLSKLNLTQVLNVGAKLQELHEMARMTGLEITANASDNHYFDVVYKVVAFSAKPVPAPNARGARSNNSRPRPGASDGE